MLCYCCKLIKYRIKRKSWHLAYNLCLAIFVISFEKIRLMLDFCLIKMSLNDD